MSEEHQNVDEQAAPPETRAALDVRFGHAKEECPDRWSGAFHTIEEAVKEGRANYGAQAFFVQGGVIPDVEDLLDEDDIIEIIRTRAMDVAGEAAEEYPDITPAQAKYLRLLVLGWLKEHARPEFWTARGKPRLVDADGVLQPEEEDPLPW
jgi:hypothetical protein